MRPALVSLLAAAAVLVAAATPAAAQAPDHWMNAFTTDPYVIAECSGYDVLEQDVVSTRGVDFFDRNGEFTRSVSHSASTGVVWRSDTGAQLATYRDRGGIFVQTADNVFTFTGIHNWWTLTDGTVIRDLGRLVVAEVAPGEFEVVFDAGQHDDRDPCLW